jgi:hypothetical protein
MKIYKDYKILVYNNFSNIKNICLINDFIVLDNVFGNILLE